jgi:hypothetical protein
MVRGVKRVVHQIGMIMMCCAGISLPVRAAPPLAKLDLRPPAMRYFDENPHFLSLAGPRSGRDQPSFGLASGQDRVVGRVQSFLERFHREGLPVARLWENRSALISLGLNSRGKPGIWLVQKTH